MNRKIQILVGFLLAVGAGSVWAHSEHEHGANKVEAVIESTSNQQALTGEVTDVFCYLSHGKEGLGDKHAGCAKKCIQNGLPVAIKSGNQLYLAVMADHTPANKGLVNFAGKQVTVYGVVRETDGQQLIEVHKIEPAQDTR